MLSRVLKSPDIFPWSSAIVSIPLLFEIRAPEEQALLTISAEDLYGRIIALNSSWVTLLRNGDQKLLEAQSGQMPITILKPGEGEIISGGIVIVSGTVEPDVPFPLRLELISGEGKLLGHKWTRDSQNENHRFNTEVVYRTTARTPARLLVYSKGDNGDQILYLTSVEIILNP
jgi:hypothetical protein